MSDHCSETIRSGLVAVKILRMQRFRIWSSLERFQNLHFNTCICKAGAKIIGLHFVCCNVAAITRPQPTR